MSHTSYLPSCRFFLRLSWGFRALDDRDEFHRKPDQVPVRAPPIDGSSEADDLVRHRHEPRPFLKAHEDHEKREQLALLVQNERKILLPNQSANSITLVTVSFALYPETFEKIKEKRKGLCFISLPVLQNCAVLTRLA